VLGALHGAVAGLFPGSSKDGYDRGTRALAELYFWAHREFERPAAAALGPPWCAAPPPPPVYQYPPPPPP
jgi:hypothetical protein